MKLEDLRRPFTLMTRDEQLSLIRSIRADRDTSKAPIEREKKRVRKRVRGIKEMFESMTPKERAEFMELIE